MRIKKYDEDNQFFFLILNRVTNKKILNNLEIGAQVEIYYIFGTIGRKQETYLSKARSFVF